ncbi:MAG: hypothetical protein ACKOB4_01250 [Acidobacteriota bacterium]
MSALLLSILSLLVVVTGITPPESSSPQQRDHLTEKEIDLVKANQEIDLRTEVFMKAAERRILVLIDPQAVQKKKEEELWGPLPKGSPLELLQDYKKILEELEEKLDDALNRDSRNPALEKAVKKAKESVSSQIEKLRGLGPKLADAKERRALLEAIEEAQLISKATF